jgi:SAM-dependent methyltransferase
LKNLTWFFSKLNLTSPITWGVTSGSHLDVGCGNYPRNPFGAKNLIGADILEREFLSTDMNFDYIKVGTDGKLPLESNSIDSVSGFDFIEHLPRGSNAESNLFIQFMNEAYRVLRSDGVLLLVTPAFPSPAAFQDPTHVNFITEETITYFTGMNPGATHLGYGFRGKFELIKQEWVGPMSRIWEVTPSVNAKHHLVDSIQNFSNHFRNLQSIRRFFSSVRNPTHLIWLIRKID